VRNSNAFEPGGDDGRDPPGAGVEKKESIRLENMKQATELLAEPGRCVHIGDRESDIFELFARPRARDALPGENLRRSFGRRR
jgi:hypothetical protein